MNLTVNLQGEKNRKFTLK